MRGPWLRRPLLAAFMKQRGVTELLYLETNVLVFGRAAELVWAARTCNMRMLLG